MTDSDTENTRNIRKSFSFFPCHTLTKIQSSNQIALSYTVDIWPDTCLLDLLPRGFDTYFDQQTSLARLSVDRVWWEWHITHPQSIHIYNVIKSNTPGQCPEQNPLTGSGHWSVNRGLLKKFMKSTMLYNVDWVTNSGLINQKVAI